MILPVDQRRMVQCVVFGWMNILIVVRMFQFDKPACMGLLERISVCTNACTLCTLCTMSGIVRKLET